MTDGDVVQIQRVLPGPLEDVWAHLTDPALVRGWLANDVTLEPELGGEVSLRLEDGRVVQGVVTQFEPPHAIAYTWGDGAVSFELVPRGEDVVLVVTHRRQADTNWRAAA